jgi:hypothetical protein
METSSTTSIRLRNSRSLAPPSETPAIGLVFIPAEHGIEVQKLDATRLVEVRDRRQDLPNTDLGPEDRIPDLSSASPRARVPSVQIEEPGCRPQTVTASLGVGPIARAGGRMMMATPVVGRRLRVGDVAGRHDAGVTVNRSANSSCVTGRGQRGV